jgi:hypothetical protein
VDDVYFVLDFLMDFLPADIAATRAATAAPGTPAPPLSVPLQAMTKYEGEGFNFIGVANQSPDFKVEPSITTYRKNGRCAVISGVYIM